MNPQYFLHCFFEPQQAQCECRITKINPKEITFFITVFLSFILLNFGVEASRNIQVLIGGAITAPEEAGSTFFASLTDNGKCKYMTVLSDWRQQVAAATGERFLNSNLLKIVVKIVYFSIANAITIHYNKME